MVFAPARRPARLIISLSKYDTVRSTLDLEMGDATSLPPPSVKRQELLLADPSLRRLVTAARESIGLRSLKGVSVVLIRPPACERQVFESSAARALDDCRRFRVVDPPLNADVSIDVGLFRTTAATKRRWAHQRLAGAALTRFVQLNLEDADPYGLSSSARAEALKTTDEAASCVETSCWTRAAAATPSRPPWAKRPEPEGPRRARAEYLYKGRRFYGVWPAAQATPRPAPGARAGAAPRWRLLPTEGDAATWRAVAAAAAARDVVWADPDVPNRAREPPPYPRVSIAANAPTAKPSSRARHALLGAARRRRRTRGGARRTRSPAAGSRGPRGPGRRRGRAS